jgi:hypothetical protein
LGDWGWRGTLGRAQICEAVSSGGEAASFYQGQAVSFDWQEFFKAQIEECRELERQAVNGEDRAFWRQAVARWEEQLRQAIRQDKEAQARKRTHPQDANAKRTLSADA